MHISKKLFQKIFFITFIAIGILWAAFVVVRYLHVDNNFLGSIFLGYKQDFGQLIIAGVILFILFALIGFTLGQNHRIKIILSAGLVITVAATLILFTQLRSIWFKIDNYSDGMRASIIIVASALMGLGLGFGLRLSHKALNLGHLAAIIIFPFLFVTLRANAVTSAIALVWFFFIGGEVFSFGHDMFSLHLIFALFRV